MNYCTSIRVHQFGVVSLRTFIPLAQTMVSWKDVEKDQGGQRYVLKQGVLPAISTPFSRARVPLKSRLLDVVILCLFRCVLASLKERMSVRRSAVRSVMLCNAFEKNTRKSFIRPILQGLSSQLSGLQIDISQPPEQLEINLKHVPYLVQFYTYFFIIH